NKSLQSLPTRRSSDLRGRLWRVPRIAARCRRPDPRFRNELVATPPQSAGFHEGWRRSGGRSADTRPRRKKDVAGYQTTYRRSLEDRKSTRLNSSHVKI